MIKTTECVRLFMYRPMASREPQLGLFRGRGVGHHLTFLSQSDQEGTRSETEKHSRRFFIFFVITILFHDWLFLHRLLCGFFRAELVLLPEVTKTPELVGWGGFPAPPQPTAFLLSRNRKRLEYVKSLHTFEPHRKNNGNQKNERKNNPKTKWRRKSLRKDSQVIKTGDTEIIVMHIISASHHQPSLLSSSSSSQYYYFTQHLLISRLLALLHIPSPIHTVSVQTAQWWP